MKNATTDQKTMAAYLKRQNPDLTIRWSEARGVAGVVIGSMLDWKVNETPELLLTRFLNAVGLLFGPPNIDKSANMSAP